MTELVILAAGRGRRLGALGDETPKWLLEVSGATIAERQLEAVARANSGGGPRVDSVTVVVGHAAAAVAQFAAGVRPHLGLLHNPEYDRLNNWYSLLLALRQLDEDAPGERLAVFNGDLLAGSHWFESFLRDAAATDSQALIAVDTVRPLTDESMKVSVRPEEPRRLDEIGKTGVRAAAGEYVGMFMVRGEARGRLRAMLESYVGSAAAADHWYEHAIGSTAADDVVWTAWPTPDSAWVEIDDERDYAAAQELSGLH
jgi:choline kinase